MQEPNIDLSDIAMIPVPWALLEEIGLDPEADAMQLSVRRGQLLIERIHAKQSRVCIGACCRCPARYCDPRDR